MLSWSLFYPLFVDCECVAESESGRVYCWENFFEGVSGVDAGDGEDGGCSGVGGDGYLVPFHYFTRLFVAVECDIDGVQ